MMHRRSFLSSSSASRARQQAFRHRVSSFSVSEMVFLVVLVVATFWNVYTFSDRRDKFHAARGRAGDKQQQQQQQQQHRWLEQRRAQEENGQHHRRWRRPRKRNRQEKQAERSCGSWGVGRRQCWLHRPFFFGSGSKGRGRRGRELDEKNTDRTTTTATATAAFAPAAPAGNGSTGAAWATPPLADHGQTTGGGGLWR
ncbi:unnamed protein product [Pylaiella littoralis]